MATPQTPNIVGQVVANCMIEKKLGAGGMGAVFLGTHQGLRNKVAIKILPAVPPPPQQFVQRFFREARALAQLEHPNIVHVYDVGQQDPYYYIVMQFIEADSIEGIVRDKGRFSISKALRIIRDIADAMAYAHERGILHRDLKPDNVLYIEELSELRLIDFGLAKFEGGGESQALTVTGQIMGTPMYMAPEQAEGRAADHRTDIYSLGALGFFCLTGDFPFTGKSGMDILLKKIREKPRNILELRPEIPQPVASLINKMMARDPEKRFQSMARVRDILNQALKPKGGDKAASEAMADSVISDVRGGASGGNTAAVSPSGSGEQAPPSSAALPAADNNNHNAAATASPAAGTASGSGEGGTTQRPTLQVGGGADGGKSGGAAKTIILILVLLIVAGGIGAGAWYLFVLQQANDKNGPGGNNAPVAPSVTDAEKWDDEGRFFVELICDDLRGYLEDNGELPEDLADGPVTTEGEKFNLNARILDRIKRAEYFDPADFRIEQVDQEANTCVVTVTGSQDNSPAGTFTLNQAGDPVEEP